MPFGQGFKAQGVYVYGLKKRRWKLTITKTSGKLGPNHYRNGAWDRLEMGFNQSIKQEKNAAAVQLLCTWLHKQP